MVAAALPYALLLPLRTTKAANPYSAGRNPAGLPTFVLPIEIRRDAQQDNDQAGDGVPEFVDERVHGDEHGGEDEEDRNDLDREGRYPKEIRKVLGREGDGQRGDGPRVDDQKKGPSESE
jgi:hypothetical protein